MRELVWPMSLATVKESTPADVHFGRAGERHAARSLVLEAAHHAHPERFVLGTPTPPALPTAAWINKPKSENGSVIAQA